MDPSSKEYIKSKSSSLLHLKTLTSDCLTPRPSFVWRSKKFKRLGQYPPISLESQSRTNTAQMVNSLDKPGMEESEEDAALLEAELPGVLLHDRPRRGTITAVTIAVIMTVTTIAILSLLYDRYHRIFYPPTTPSYVSPSCGETSAEARANGCQYEPMMRGWIPDDCFTPEPAAEYAPFDDRLWFYDENLTLPMSPDVLRNGDDVTAWTKTFHDEHCLYAWRKLALAVDRRLPLVDSKTMNLHHSTHCSKQIARFIREVHSHVWVDNRTASAPLQFETCVPLFS